MKKIISMGIIFLVSGCGTIKTTLQDDYDINRDLYRNETKCKSLPRIYSGVAYDFCRFHAEPKGTASPSLNGLNIYFFDILLLSPILDTAILPITIYKQVKYGSLELKRPY